MEVLRRGIDPHQGWCIMDQQEERLKSIEKARDMVEEDEENIYSSEARERLVDEDTLSTDEDAFMLGYEKGLRAVEEEEEESWDDEHPAEEIA
ncbi:hypothetical protein HYU22_05160 [Candidatus Woesearchaeota archaeon]|nr:hypothetical protein [Candidatus Woesearchaeota archaeon]